MKQPNVDARAPQRAHENASAVTADGTVVDANVRIAVVTLGGKQTARFGVMWFADGTGRVICTPFVLFLSSDAVLKLSSVGRYP